MGARKNAAVDEAVLECAYSLFAKQGVDATSLSDIASACGISKGTLYYYYPSRENLISLCAETCVRYMGDAILSWAETLTQESTVESICTGLAEVFSLEHEDVRLMLSLFRCGNIRIRQLMEGALAQWKIMLEVGALKLRRRYSERFSALSSVMLYTLIGIAATGGNAELAVSKLLSVIG